MSNVYEQKSFKNFKNFQKVFDIVLWPCITWSQPDNNGTLLREKVIWLLNIEIILFFADQFSLRDNKYGVVQLRRYGIIGEFCDSFWTDKNSDVLCRQLGFGGGKAAFYSRINKKQITAPYLGSFDCNGTEKSLSQCTERDPFICYSSLAAGAICYLYQGMSILCYAPYYSKVCEPSSLTYKINSKQNIEFYAVPIYVLRNELNQMYSISC